MRSLLRPWPGLVFVLLGMNMVVVGITLWAALGDPSFAVVPRYDVKAANWQATVEERARWAATGRVVEIAPVVAGEPLRVRLAERDGRGLEGARVEALVFHHATAAERRTGLLAAEGPGAYGSSALRLDRAGSWRVALEIVHGMDRVVVERDIVVPSVPSAASIAHPVAGGA